MSTPSRSTRRSFIAVAGAALSAPLAAVAATRRARIEQPDPLKMRLEQLEDLLRIQKLRFQALSVDPSQGGLFGQIAVRKGWVSLEQLAECLRQQETSAKAGSSLRLGQILLQKKYLTVPQFLEIIRLQNKEVAQCPKCHTFFDTHEASPGTPFGCSSCGHMVRSPV